MILPLSLVEISYVEDGGKLLPRLGSVRRVERLDLRSR